MGIVDKVIAAVTPPESDEARLEARQKARSLATPGSWLALVLEHHLEIEEAFDQVRSANQAGSRRLAEKRLAVLLTGHSMAEEAVLYPALALNHEKGSSEMSYVEQSATKVQLAALEDLDPMSQDYLDKLEHIRGAVAHHVYEEEGSRYPSLLEKIDPTKNEMLTMRYREESQRYAKDTSGVSSGVGMASAAPLASA